jgi:polysaccharide export outer membrane protein
MILRENPLIISFCRNGSLLASVTLLCLFSSCVTQRDIEYLQDKDKNIKAFDEAEFPDYKLKPNDELYIQISSLDEGAASIFSDSRQQIAYLGAIQPYGAYLLAYSVDKEGYLLLPVIGKILVKDKTLSDVNLILRDSLNHILSQPVVSVKLVNRYISIMGEVRNPGHFPYSQDKLTIYDGLGLAGDITDYGNRENVILVRNENGENIRVNVNLKQSDILASDYYYLRPNDILYVKPLRNKFWGLRQFPWSVFFSAITTGLLIYEIVQDN